MSLCRRSFKRTPVTLISVRGRCVKSTEGRLWTRRGVALLTQREHANATHAWNPAHGLLILPKQPSGPSTVDIRRRRDWGGAGVSHVTVWDERRTEKKKTTLWPQCRVSNVESVVTKPIPDFAQRRAGGERRARAHARAHNLMLFSLCLVGK